VPAAAKNGGIAPGKIADGGGGDFRDSSSSSFGGESECQRLRRFLAREISDGRTPGGHRARYVGRRAAPSHKQTMSALTNFSNAAQWSPNGRPVGPNLQLNEKPLGSVGAQRATEPRRTPWSLGFDRQFSGSGHMSTSIRSRQDNLKDNKVYLTEKRTLTIHD